MNLIKVIVLGVFFGASFSTVSSAAVLAESAIEIEKQSLFYQVIERTNATPVSAISFDSAERIDALSKVFIGAPYAGGSLGEGEQGKYDTDPLVRFGEFDCTTYIETVLAGALSQSADDFMSNLIHLRYKGGNVTFTQRNHFPSLDWIPNNQDKLKDITDIVAQSAMLTAEATIDKPSWYQNMAKKNLHCDDDLSEHCDALLVQFNHEGDAYLPEIATVDYVPLTAIYPMENSLDASEMDMDKSINQTLLDRIPSGSLITMVRPDWSLKKWIGTNMNVSHQAIAIRKGGQLFLRHASEVHKKVLDEDFVEYFSRYSSTSSLKGFNVQVLRE